MSFKLIVLILLLSSNIFGKDSAELIEYKKNIMREYQKMSFISPKELRRIRKRIQKISESDMLAEKNMNYSMKVRKPKIKDKESDKKRKKILRDKSTRAKNQKGGCVISFNSTSSENYDNFLEYGEIESKDECQKLINKGCSYFGDQWGSQFLLNSKKICRSTISLFWINMKLEKIPRNNFRRKNSLGQITCTPFGHVSRHIVTDSGTKKSGSNEVNGMPEVQKQCLKNLKDVKYICEIKWKSSKHNEVIAIEELEMEDRTYGLRECNKKAKRYHSLCKKHPNLTNFTIFSVKTEGKTIQVFKSQKSIDNCKQKQ